ncbi:MAG: penicillin-binding transpeptidase domain-containing protein, partial [Bacillota bacterium]
AVQNSCNVAFVNMGLRLGARRFTSYIDSFGFSGITGIDLPGEATGITIKAELVKTVDLACMAFGQTLTVTPIQLITSMAAIANGGMIVKPHLVKEIRTPDGAFVQSSGQAPPRRVISAKTAQEMRACLQQVVERGTGRQAQIEGYKIAGKTGTANKVIGGRIAEGKYISSFFGFAPADNPRLIALVTIDEPTGEYFGGVIAAPVFNAMVADILKYLGVPPASAQERTQPAAAKGPAWVPDLAHLTVEDAREAVTSAGLTMQVLGSGSVVTSQEPAAGSEAPAGSAVTADTSESAAAGQAGMIMVPSVLGKTIREATDTLSGFGLEIQVKGSGFAVSQEPAPGTQVQRKQTIRVEFRAPE